MNFKEGEVLFFDKPLTWTSFAVVNKIRYHLCRQMGVKKLKVGHAGTLDPLATGVMIICTGKATKRIEEFQYHTKEYVATLMLGATTPSYDLEKEIDATYPTEHITRELVEETLKKFIGSIEQVPPAFSACMVDGKRAYDLARKGEEVKLKAKTLVIDEIELLECNLPVIKIRVVCSKGTYIRALARDIGEALSCGATMTALHRTTTGGFDVCDAVELDALTRENLAEYILPEETALLSLREVKVTEKQAIRFGNGGQLAYERLKNASFEDGELLRIKFNDKFLGVGIADNANAQIAIKCVINQ